MRSPITLSDHITFIRLMRFTAPTVLMMLISSVYGVVDGWFVSNIAGKTAFAAVNLIWPFPMLLGAVGFMLGSGGCALVSKKIGEGKEQEARGLFSMFFAVAVSSGLLLMTIGLFFVEDVSIMLGAKEGEMLDDCVCYASLLIISLPMFILQSFFQPFMVAAERPQWGMMVITAAGIVNIMLDWLLIAKMGHGVAGAGWATLASQTVGASVPILLFCIKKPRALFFGKVICSMKALGKACSNGLSEFAVNASMPFVNLLYVFFLLGELGEEGVGAYGVIMYVNVVFFNIYTGYSMGVSPLISYHYGAGNQPEVANILRKSIMIILGSALTVFSLAIGFDDNVAQLFAGYDANFHSLVERAFLLYSISFMLAPFNIFASAFFTALNNGTVSALISLSRILLFQLSALIILPRIIGTDGYWLAMPAAEALCLILSIALVISFRKKYRY